MWLTVSKFHNVEALDCRSKDSKFNTTQVRNGLGCVHKKSGFI